MNCSLTNQWYRQKCCKHAINNQQRGVAVASPDYREAYASISWYNYTVNNYDTFSQIFYNLQRKLYILPHEVFNKINSRSQHHESKYEKKSIKDHRNLLTGIETLIAN